MKRELEMAAEPGRSIAIRDPVVKPLPDNKFGDTASGAAPNPMLACEIKNDPLRAGVAF